MILMACLMYVFHKFQRRYLTDNNIGDTGATSLSEALKSNTTLITLYMNRENKKMSKKMSIIKTHFSFCFILTVNEIGDTGATSLSVALKSNTTLTELKLTSDHTPRRLTNDINSLDSLCSS